MRDPARIDRIIKEIHMKWIQCPDLRLCQLLSTVARKEGWEQDDLFNLEDAILLAAIKKFDPRPVPPEIRPAQQQKQGHAVAAHGNDYTDMNKIRRRELLQEVEKLEQEVHRAPTAAERTNGLRGICRIQTKLISDLQSQVSALQECYKHATYQSSTSIPLDDPTKAAVMESDAPCNHPDGHKFVAHACDMGQYGVETCEHCGAARS